MTDSGSPGQHASESLLPAGVWQQHDCPLPKYKERRIIEEVKLTDAIHKLKGLSYFDLVGSPENNVITSALHEHFHNFHFDLFFFLFVLNT